MESSLFKLLFIFRHAPVLKANMLPKLKYVFYWKAKR